MSSATGRHRPASVTAVVALVVVAAVLDFALGAIVLVAASSSGSPVDGSPLVTALGAGALVLGVATALVALGLWRGHPLARVVTIGIEALSIVVSIVGILLRPSTLGSALPGMVIASVVVFLLFRPDASRFFRRS